MFVCICFVCVCRVQLSDFIPMFSWNHLWHECLAYHQSSKDQHFVGTPVLI